MRLLRHSVWWLAGYLVAWVVAYSAIMLSRGDGLDFSHLVEYFVLAWTFGGGELVSFIWFLSLVIFVLLGVVRIILVWRYGRSTRQRP